VRTISVLQRAGITTLEAVARSTAEELLRHRNFGRAVVEGIQEMLAEYGLYLRGEGEKPDGSA
jgi:DNA-directed RNA polymerase alpha subunit